MVFAGLVIAWRFAGAPTNRSPAAVNATTEDVVRAPSMLAMTTGSPPSMTETTEFVVPRSIPMIFDMLVVWAGWGLDAPGCGATENNYRATVLRAQRAQNKGVRAIDEGDLRQFGS